MKRTLFILLAAAALAGCTSTVSKNVRADGSVGELVWPSQKDSWRDEALRLPSPTIAAVKVGLERKNVFALLDVPHFSEINGAREWNYILQRPEYTRENQAVCHLKLIYGDDDRIAAQYWLPQDCANVYAEPAALQPYRLAADALFTFDSATLRPEADAALADLLAKVREHNDSDPIRVDGYTDRLGTEAHNRALSQARADAVKHYLVRGGIAEKRIRASGFASERPLSHCSDNLPRAALITCLQPDRRVEVSVGTAR